MLHESLPVKSPIEDKINKLLYVAALNARKQGISADRFAEKYFLKAPKKNKLSTFHGLETL